MATDQEKKKNKRDKYKKKNRAKHGPPELGIKAVNLSSVATVTKQFCRLHVLLLFVVPTLCPPPPHPTPIVSAQLHSPFTSLLVFIHLAPHALLGPYLTLGPTFVDQLITQTGIWLGYRANAVK